jgi:hypothetical protein
VDLGKVHTQFGDKNKIRIIWVLDKSDSGGQPFRVMRQLTASMNEKAALYELVKGILGTAPPVPFDDETLIGRSNQLVVVKEADPKTGKVFANVKVVLPLPAGVIPPQAPQGFVRSKNKVQTQGQAVAASAAPVVQITANTTASTPTAQPTVQGQANPASTQAVAAAGAQPLVQVDASF